MSLLTEDLLPKNTDKYYVEIEIDTSEIINDSEIEPDDKSSIKLLHLPETEADDKSSIKLLHLPEAETDDKSSIKLLHLPETEPEDKSTIKLIHLPESSQDQADVPQATEDENQHPAIPLKPTVEAKPKKTRKQPTKIRKARKYQSTNQFSVSYAVSEEEDVVEKAHENGTTEYLCPSCPFSSLNYRSVRNHMPIHANKDSYKCIHCDFRGKNFQDLINHHKSKRHKVV